MLLGARFARSRFGGLDNRGALPAEATAPDPMRVLALQRARAANRSVRFAEQLTARRALIMGWLREAMSQAGIRSFGELTRQALAHPDWPEDSKAQPRSLEAIFGRIDKKIELDWLSDRPGIQQILAELLKLGVSEIRSVLMDVPGTRQTYSRLRLDDLPSARGFDFAQEPLPPTIPERIGLPSTWVRCCWLAPPGSGFSLASHWLSSRGLAQCAAVETLEDLEQLPLTGPPLLLELPFELLPTAIDRWRGVQPLCVATAVADVRQRPLSGFELLRSIPARDCLAQIVDWVLVRLGGQRATARQSLLDWLSHSPVEWGLIESLGDALGLAGAFVEGIVDPTRTPTKESLLRQWIAHRTEHLARERHRDTAALRNALPEILIDVAQGVLTDDTRPLLTARSIDEWLALVPPHHQRGPDIDWLTTQLVSENLPMRKPDLERAAQRLPPGAHRIVVALRELGILRPTSASRFSIRPHFLARLTHAIAKERIVGAAPLFWGEALLRPLARAALLPTLQARADAQPEGLAEDTLEHVDLESPALVCAFETSFILVGLASLSGAEVSDQTAASLLEEQQALLIPGVSSIPCPRTVPAAPTGLADLKGTFWLAAWALSEHSRIHGSVIHPTLDPWHAPSLPVVWPELLDCVAQSVRAALPLEPPWLAGAVRLLDRIRQSIGTQVGPDHTPHELFVAGTLLDAVELGVVEWGQLHELSQEPWQQELFQLSARVRKTSREQLARAILLAWSDAGRPSSGHRLFQTWPADFVGLAPPTLLACLLMTSECVLTPHQMTALPPAVWQEWLGARAQTALDTEPELPWRFAPAATVEQALTTRPPVRDRIRGEVWQQHATIVARHIERHRTLSPELAADWLRAAPAEQAPAIAERALKSDWLRAAEVFTGALQQLMHRAVAERVSHWPAAYDCLNQLQVARRRFEDFG